MTNSLTQFCNAFAQILDYILGVFQNFAEPLFQLIGQSPTFTFVDVCSAIFAGAV
jgi:hypothetical protein